LFGKIKRALIGLPIYKGHGDLADFDKTALGNTAAKIKLGTVDQIRKSQRGLEAHFVLDNDGADAVAAGWKFPSVLWRVAHTGTQGDAIIGTPFKLLSVALTQFPNISGVDSLANARSNEPAASGGSATNVVTETQKQNDTMKQLLIGWLAAQGVVLANDAADQSVFDAFNKEMLLRSTNIATLGNEKTTLATKTSTLENDLAESRKKLTEATTALGNEQTARKSERTRAAKLAVDLAIQKGKLTPAERDARITTLENSADFDADVKALTDGAPVVKLLDAQPGWHRYYQDKLAVVHIHD
jgi:phage I-like protein